MTRTSSRPARVLVVEEAGPLLTVQDLGRPGLAALGVPESGALDPAALRLANRLVGNPESAAGLETTFGGVSLRAHGDLVIAVTGAPAPVLVDGRPHSGGEPVRVPDGALVEIGRPDVGLRSYLAVRGGVVDREWLGSASTDLLSGLGAPLEPGEALAVGGKPDSAVPAQDHVPSAVPAGTVQFRAMLGPRDDWFTDAAVAALTATEWTAGSRSNRIGIRLEGASLERRSVDELPSEGAVAGALQVQTGGAPTLFLADHPVTGGYPVIAVVLTADLPLAAQARPGTRLRIRLVAGPDLDRVADTDPDQETP